MESNIIQKNKKKIRDLLLSVCATMVLNVVIQFALYPYMQRQLGDEQYGVALSVLSLVAILSGTLGTSANYSRMVTSSKPDTVYTNGDYNIILLGVSLLCALGGSFYLGYLGVASIITVPLFVLLTVFTALRYYSDVEFRMKSDFVRYMLYYVTISCGYLLGLIVFKISGEWMTAVVLGEMLGVLFVVIFGTIYRSKLLTPSKNFLTVSKSMGFLLLSTFIENLTLNADRLLLMVFSGGVAVSIYYTASLLGKVIAMLTVPINSIIISYLVKYEGGMSKKFWSISTIASGVVGVLAFVACLIVSPFLLGILYPDLLGAATPFIAPAILGQIFYFISGVLLVILLRFKGEKNQFLFNLIYAVEFIAIVTLGTLLFDLTGFVYSALIANAIRFVMVVCIGFFSNPKAVAK